MTDLKAYVSEHFKFGEFITSDYAIRHGIDNTPSPAVEARMLAVLVPGMERVRQLLGAPIYISSGYRSPTLNRLVGGSKTSQHVDGCAADFVSPSFGPPRAIAAHLHRFAAYIKFDQMIHEGSWLHISFVEVGERSQVLTAHFANGRVTYTPGLA